LTAVQRHIEAFREIAMIPKTSSLLLCFLISLPAPAAAQESLQHPMLSVPGGPISIDGSGQHLVHGITNKSIFYLKAPFQFRNATSGHKLHGRASGE